MILLKAQVFLLVWIGLLKGKRLFWFQKHGFKYQDPIFWTKSSYCSQSLYYQQQSWRDCKVMNKLFSSTVATASTPKTSRKFQFGGKKILGKESKIGVTDMNSWEKGLHNPAHPRFKSMVLESGLLREFLLRRTWKHKKLLLHFTGSSPETQSKQRPMAES